MKDKLNICKDDCFITIQNTKKSGFHLQMGHALIHYTSSNYPLTIIITGIVSSCQSLAFNILSSELFTFPVSNHNI